MKLGQLYRQVVKLGVARDPRKKKNFSSFADTAILYGHPDTEVKKIMAGIDIEVGELLLADKIRNLEGLDLVIAHHPQGRALAEFYRVMQLQVDIARKIGIAQKTAQEFIDSRMGEVERKVIAQNHLRSVDAAQLLDLPFMCVHTPADNHVYHFITTLLKEAKPKKVKDIIQILKKIPEYKMAEKESSGPKIIIGNPNGWVGKILVEMTGGTEGPKDIIPKLKEAGIKTFVSMHLSEEYFKKVRDSQISVVIAGHISSDTLGLNLLFDRIEKEAKQKFEFVNCSGFKRIRR